MVARMKRRRNPRTYTPQEQAFIDQGLTRTGRKKKPRPVDPVHGPFSPKSFTIRDAEKNPILHAVLGNSKLGKYVMSVSLVPIGTCMRGVPCATRKGCYAIKFWFAYGKTTRPAWRHNTSLIKNDPKLFEESVRAVLIKGTSGKNRIELFRWFPSGDFYDQEMVLRVLSLAAEFPNVPFLAYTKRYDLQFPEPAKMPSNFQLIYSQWPGWTPPRAVPTGARRAWVTNMPVKLTPQHLLSSSTVRELDGDQVLIDPRVPRNAFKCPGQCTSCKFCWNAGKLGRDVVFDYH